MRIATAILLLALLTLPRARASAQGTAMPPAAKVWKVWTGKSVALARVDGRSMAAACPTRTQVDHFVRERTLKWDDASIGCRFLLSGNFTGAQVVEESGDYIRVTFTLASSRAEHTYWTPRRNFRLQS